MADKKKYQRGTTPAGIAAWPRLTEPDRAFNPDGVYSVNLRLESDAAQSMITMIDRAHAEKVKETTEELRKKGNAKAKVKESEKPYRLVVDEDGNETGEVEFKFKLKAVAGSKDRQWNQKPRLFDSKGKPLSSVLSFYFRDEVLATNCSRTMPRALAPASACEFLLLRSLNSWNSLVVLSRTLASRPKMDTKPPLKKRLLRRGRKRNRLTKLLTSDA